MIVALLSAILIGLLIARQVERNNAGRRNLIDTPAHSYGTAPVPPREPSKKKKKPFAKWAA